MTHAQWNAVDDYFTAALKLSDDVLDATLKSSTDAGLPEIAVAPNQGKLLYLLAKIAGAKRVLEIGTLGGYSTIWLARALPSDGTLVSLEFDARHADVARTNIERAGLAKIASVVVGPAAQSLDRLIADKATPFDFVFIDADKENNAVYLQRALALSRPGTVIVADNVVRGGRVADPGNRDTDVAGVRQYFEATSADPRLDTTAVQTVGVKGWDGFAITVVSA